MRKFWNWARDADTGERVLTMRGPIADETWYGDEVTPGEFRNELEAGDGNITAWIDSPGGDVFAAAQIYNMLKDYKGGAVNVHVDSLAASAASVIAMAGKTVEISPTGYMMIHNPSMMAWGDSAEMQRAKNMLDTVKEGIINAYEIKTGLPRDELSRMMDAETWLDAKSALKMGFADKIMFEGESENEATDAMMFSRAAITNSLLTRIKAKDNGDPVRIILPEASENITAKAAIVQAEPVLPRGAEPSNNKVDAAALYHRLNLISH